MSITEEKINRRDGADKTRRIIFIVAGLIAIGLIVGLIVYLKRRPEPPPATVLDQKLEGGLRAGSPDFEKYRDLIKLDEPEADYSDTVAGGIQMRLATTVRNFTGRTINGLEMKGTVTDLDGKTIKDRTMVVIPSGAISELENNQTARVPIPIPGFKGSDSALIESGQAKIKVEVTAIKFK
jgi:hypothetical protein